MNDGLKALPTEFAGITFRSRTEARWAVFFTAAGLAWEHEREGFDVEGRWYLPDFHLPDFPMWFEVKPDETDKSELEHFSALCRLTEKRGIIAYGPPKSSRENLMFFDKQGRRTDGMFRLLPDRRNDGEFWLYADGHMGFSIGPVNGPDHGAYPVLTEKLRKAFEAAESARFGT